MVNNQKAVSALDRFMNNLEGVIPSLARTLIQTVLLQTVKPVENEIQSQRDTIQMIESSLNQTVAGQENTRNELQGQFDEVGNLKKQYQELIGSIAQPA